MTWVTDRPPFYRAAWRRLGIPEPRQHRVRVKLEESLVLSPGLADVHLVEADLGAGADAGQAGIRVRPGGWGIASSPGRAARGARTGWPATHRDRCLTVRSDGLRELRADARMPCAVVPAGDGASWVQRRGPPSLSRGRVVMVRVW